MDRAENCAKVAAAFEKARISTQLLELQ